MTNFLPFNPSAANQETDAAYLADSTRVGGAAVGQPLPSPTGNKMFYQFSIMIAALAQALEAKGYTVNDTNLINLQAVLANLLTQNDLLPYAPKANPQLTGGNELTTPAYNDNTTKIANMAAVNAQPVGLAASGFIKFGNGLVLQWLIGPTDISTGEPQHTVNFPTPFPNQCFVCLVSMDMANITISADFWYQTIGWNTLSVTYMRQVSTGGTTGGTTTRAIIFAIGN